MNMDLADSYYFLGNPLLRILIINERMEQGNKMSSLRQGRKLSYFVPRSIGST